jgi:hypothetical protein
MAMRYPANSQCAEGGVELHVLAHRGHQLVGAGVVLADAAVDLQGERERKQREEHRQGHGAGDDGRLR